MLADILGRDLVRGPIASQSRARYRENVFDARGLTDIPDRWKQEAEHWRGVPFVWTRWLRPSEQWDHDHCRFCWACICDARDRDPNARRWVVEGGHFRYAYYAEQADGIYVWVCRTCFKRVQSAFGWTRATARGLERCPRAS